MMKKQMLNKKIKFFSIFFLFGCSEEFMLYKRTEETIQKIKTEKSGNFNLALGVQNAGEGCRTVKMEFGPWNAMSNAEEDSKTSFWDTDYVNIIYMDINGLENWKRLSGDIPGRINVIATGENIFPSLKWTKEIIFHISSILKKGGRLALLIDTLPNSIETGDKILIFNRIFLPENSSMKPTVGKDSYVAKKIVANEVKKWINDTLLFQKVEVKFDNKFPIPMFEKDKENPHVCVPKKDPFLYVIAVK